MKRMTTKMSDDILIRALRRMAPETGSLHCLGCGCEHWCSIHGCAIIKQAAERLEQLTTPAPNAPLTQEELYKMDGEPVWVTSCSGEWPRCYIVDVEEDELRSPWEIITIGDWKSGWPYRAYRRKPEEDDRVPSQPTAPGWAEHLKARFLRTE